MAASYVHQFPVPLFSHESQKSRTLLTVFHLTLVHHHPHIGEREREIKGPSIGMRGSTCSERLMKLAAAAAHTNRCARTHVLFAPISKARQRFPTSRLLFFLSFELPLL